MCPSATHISCPRSTGGAFAGLVGCGFAVELRENRRQVEAWERTALDHLRNGQVDRSRFLRSQADRPAIEHGYAITCHIAQGMTVDRAYVLASSGLCREWGYTALTRGRRENLLYLADRPVHERDACAPGSGVHVLTALVRLQVALERSDAEPLALDHGRPLRLREHELGLGVDL